MGPKNKGSCNCSLVHVTKWVKGTTKYRNYSVLCQLISCLTLPLFGYTTETSKFIGDCRTEPLCLGFTSASNGQACDGKLACLKGDGEMEFASLLGLVLHASNAILNIKSK